MLFNRKQAATGPTPEELARQQAEEEAKRKAAEEEAAKLAVRNTPANVSKEDFDKLQATMYQLQDNVTNFFMQQNKPNAPAAPVIPQIEDVSDEEYEKAIMGELDRRTAAQVVQKRATAIAKRENAAIQQELNQLKSVGMGAISNLTVQGLASKPYYKDYKKEIDAAIAQLDPASRVNAEALNGVYNYIVGGHMDEILAKEREAVLRQAAPKPDALLPGGRAATPGAPVSTAPDPKDVLDPLALAMIRDKYGSTSPAAVEKFCQSQRFESWEAYYNKVYKPFEDTQGNA